MHAHTHDWDMTDNDPWFPVYLEDIIQGDKNKL